MSNKELRL